MVRCGKPKPSSYCTKFDVQLRTNIYEAIYSYTAFRIYFTDSIPLINQWPSNSEFGSAQNSNQNEMVSGPWFYLKHDTLLKLNETKRNSNI